MVSMRSATVPDQRSRLAKASGSVVRKLIHQAGRGSALSMVLGRQCRWDREAVLHVSQAGAADGCVDRDHESVVTGRCCAVDECE